MQNLQTQWVGLEGPSLKSLTLIIWDNGYQWVIAFPSSQAKETNGHRSGTNDFSVRIVSRNTGGRCQEDWEPFGSRESRTDRRTAVLLLRQTPEWHSELLHQKQKEAEWLQRRQEKENKTLEASLKRYKFAICATDLLRLISFSRPDVWIGSWKESADDKRGKICLPALAIKILGSALVAVAVGVSPSREPCWSPLTSSCSLRFQRSWALAAAMASIMKVVVM